MSRQAVVDTARRLNAAGINRALAGNVSARLTDGFLITPSGVPYEELTPGAIVTVAADGTVGPRARPSSEWRIHHDIYRHRPEVGAVVHAHPPFATTLACLRRPIPPFHYMVAVAGGHDIRCCPYATFGTQELSDHVVAALVDRRAALMEHHGLVALGPTAADALALAVEVEVLATQYIAALAIGEPPELTPAQMDEVLAKMASPDGYGSSPDPG